MTSFYYALFNKLDDIGVFSSSVILSRSPSLLNNLCLLPPALPIVAGVGEHFEKLCFYTQFILWLNLPGRFVYADTECVLPKTVGPYSGL